jgi:hypothetical protein
MFVTGFERGLRIMHGLLRERGVAVVSEAVWLRPTGEVPEDLLAFWRESYPPMADVAGNLALARKAGFEALGHFTLADEGWAAYADPLERG